MRYYLYKLKIVNGRAVSGRRVASDRTEKEVLERSAKNWPNKGNFEGFNGEVWVYDIDKTTGREAAKIFNGEGI